MKDILGKAISGYFEGDKTSKLWINNTYGEPDEMPLDYYFRDKLNMPELEHFALEHCRGKILDIGAAAGAHSLILQDLKQEDISYFGLRSNHVVWCFTKPIDVV